MTTIRQGEAADIGMLTVIWRRSVEATHDFLTTADINALEPEVRGGIGALELWVGEVDGRPGGFMAMRENMIEALFIDPDAMGKGLGTKFLEHARSVIGPARDLRVDVNEDNGRGRGFYLSRGFEITGRSATDAAGRPWPLLHLTLRPDTEAALHS